MKLFVDALLIVLLFGYTSCTKAKRNKGEFHRSSSTVIIPSLEQKKNKKQASYFQIYSISYIRAYGNLQKIQFGCFYDLYN